MRTIRCIAILVLAAAGGCGSSAAPAPDARVLELRSLLDSYRSGGPNEPIDSQEHKDRMLVLLKSLDPLDNAEKSEVALDIFEYYDATDNEAAGCAREMLIRNGVCTLPYVRARLEGAPNPDEVRRVIEEIGRH
jgi:hypothetical protein